MISAPMFIVNFEHILHFSLVFLLLTLREYLFGGLFICTTNQLNGFYMKWKLALKD